MTTTTTLPLATLQLTGRLVLLLLLAALPSNFFDNPQADSRNKGREVAKTQKQQSLTDEFAEFEKQVAADLVAAEEADDAAEEDEEEAKLREAVSVARELENKLEGLRKQRRLPPRG